LSKAVRLLGRILAIVFAFLVASMAAALVLVIGMAASGWNDLLAGAADTVGLAIVAGFGAVFISGFALLPVLLIILVAEGFGWRSALFYAAAGLALALFFHYGLIDEVTPSGFRTREIMAGAGIAGGLVYWALAGRNAGKWRETASQAR
jgi:hypothetical protein